MFFFQQYKQIGNAVPVPLALALGRELGKAFIKHWELEQQRGEDERELSPDVDIEL